MRKTIAFFGVCSARSELTLVSPRIARSFSTVRFQAEFADGVNDFMQIKFFVGPGDFAPSSGEPDGHSLLSDYGQVDYIVGDGFNKDFDHEVKIAESGSFLKVYANNTDYYDHDVIALVTIEVD